MSKTLAVAARELRERWLLFPAGLVLGSLPLALPAFGLPPDATPLIGLAIALSVGAAAALLTGSSMLARDASDGRLGFLFTRPLPWPAIWGGKWLAAVALVAGSGLLATVPWILVGPPEIDGGALGGGLLDPQRSTFFLLLLLLAVGFANFNATAFRSRSAWLAVDTVLLLLAVWAYTSWVAPLYYLQILGPYRPGWWALLLPLGPVALALVAASVPQVAVGRTDVRRAHRAMSVAFWSLVFVALAAAGLRLAWARGATPADLHVNAESHDPSGRWLYAFGWSERGGAMTFLIDTDSGRHVPMGLERRWGNQFLGMAFATDGSSGVTLSEHDGATALEMVDLGGDEPRFSRVSLESSPPPGSWMRLALSPSGATALLVHEHGASLFALPSGERIATATLTPGWRAVGSRFTSDSTGRIWLIPAVGRHRAEIRALDIVPGGEVRTTTAPLEAALDPVRGWPHIVLPDADGRRILTRDGGVRLRDGETGALLATLVEGSAPVSPAVFLADGRIVVGEAEGARTVLHVFAADGTTLTDVVLDRVASGLGVGPEVAPGRVAVHFMTGGGGVVVDAGEGRVVGDLPGGHGVPGFWMLDGPAQAPGAEAPTVHFYWKGERPGPPGLRHRRGAGGRRSRRTSGREAETRRRGSRTVRRMPWTCWS